jgi:hypothetical protein
MCAEPRDLPTVVDAVASELWSISRKKRRGLVDLGICREIAQTPAIKAEAEREALVFDSVSVVLAALTSVLKGLREEEEQEGASGDYPFARPAMELLGLTPSTAHKRITQRQAIAARSRRVSAATIRRHEKPIYEELATYLCSSAVSVPSASPSLPPAAVEAAETRLAELWHQRIYNEGDVPHLSAEELPALISALAGTYKTVAIELEEVQGRAMQDGWDGLAEEDVEPYELRPLRALAERGFDGNLVEWHLCYHAKEATPPDERLRLLAGLLDAVSFYMPAFSKKEEAFLEYVAQEARGNWYRFSELLVAEKLGQEIEKYWQEWLFANPRDRFQLRLEIQKDFRDSFNVLSRDANRAISCLRSFQRLQRESTPHTLKIAGYAVQLYEIESGIND